MVSTDGVDAFLGRGRHKIFEYVSRGRGNIQKGIASGLEFSVFLVDPRTQEVIWGARFVGSQKLGFETSVEKKQTGSIKKDSLVWR
ncbi:MAG: hypothetical protein CM1200mP16_15570 [Nitrospina sp.]|nr:MAG: hypothetical protein CM1200mP16_15570 [Nitrospina sp.]